MIQTSSAYKTVMNKPIRNRGYISVSLGVVNQNAQGNAKLDENTTKEYYSKGNLFNDADNEITYGTLEQNFTKANGTFVFPPRNNPNADLQDNGLVVPYGESLIVKFDTDYDIKGLTIDFVETSYPTDFTIITDEETITVSDNTTANFTTDEVLGSTSTITITPTSMLGGVQCMHVKRVVMGVGITFQSSTVESAELESFVSGVSIETSYKELNVSAFDNSGKFDVDNDSAFINYLQTGQSLNISFGVDLDDGTQEWFQVASCRLKEWSAKKGRISLRATDLLAQTEETYSNMVIESRTAKSELEAIFTSMGLLPGDYHIDDYFASVYITNPIEENTYRDCLQLIANATRGIIYEDENGIVHAERNFDRQIEISDAGSTGRYATKKSDSRGTEYWESTQKALYDGTFRTIVGKNLFNPDLVMGNSLEVKNISPHEDSPLLDFYVANNFVYKSNSAVSNGQAEVEWLIKCPKSSLYFPITESGWYCAIIANSTVAPQYINPQNAYAKLGDWDLTIEATDQIFQFYVSPESLNKGDLEISFGSLLTYLRSNGMSVSIRKGKMNDSQRMVDDGTKVYDNYFTSAYRPQITWTWNSYVSTAKKVLFRFIEPKPTQIIVEERANNQTLTETQYTIAQNVLEYYANEDADAIRVTIVAGHPNQKAIIYQPLTIRPNNYVLPYFNMMEHPYATMDEKVKAIRVKICSYEVEDNEIRQVDDEVYYTETFDSTGVVKTVENPLISTLAQAELVAKWLKAYYVKNITYDVEYRGEPALQANDMIYMENDYTMINPVDAEKVTLNFNGAFSGTIEARKALIVEN